MKTIQIFFVTVALLFVSGAAQAQGIFFPTKQGVVLNYANKDAKGKITGYVRNTIKAVEGSGDNFSITYAGEVFDAKEKPLGDQSIEVLYTVIVNDGVVEWDMKSFGGVPGQESLMTVEGDKLRIPKTLSPGDKLADVTYKISINVGIKMGKEISLTDMQCLAIEDVTVPAGTFKCHKVTQTGSTKVLGRLVVTKTLSWYAPGVGTVKNESYDSKDKLTGSMELIELTN